MTIVMLVIMTETTADILAVGEVVDRPADGRTVVAGLRADCLSTAVSGGLLNSFSASAFAQNVGLVAITGVKSRFVVAASGVILVVLGLFPKVGAIVAAIPTPGARRRRPGTVRHGRRQRHPGALSRVTYEGNNNLVIVALSIGMGVIPIAVPTFYEHFPSWFQTVFDSGISSAAVTAVLLNLLFNVSRRRADGGRDCRRVPTLGVTPDYDVPAGRRHPTRSAAETVQDTVGALARPRTARPAVRGRVRPPAGRTRPRSPSGRQPGRERSRRGVDEWRRHRTVLFGSILPSSENGAGTTG